MDGRKDGRTSQPEQGPYLFESRQFGSVLDVPQAGALSRQLLGDPLVLGVLRSQHQAGMVAQLPQVLQRLREGGHPGKAREKCRESNVPLNYSSQMGGGGEHRFPSLKVCCCSALHVFKTLNS